MAWKDDVLEVMPLNVEISTIEIVDALKPRFSKMSRKDITSRAYSSLKILEKWQYVKLLRTDKHDGKEVNIWMRI